jgi:hypothetical protein
MRLRSLERRRLSGPNRTVVLRLDWPGVSARTLPALEDLWEGEEKLNYGVCAL